MNLEILDRLGRLQQFGPGMVTLRNDIENLVRERDDYKEQIMELARRTAIRSLESAEKSEWQQQWYDIEKLVRRLESAEESEQLWYDVATAQDEEIESLRSCIEELKTREPVEFTEEIEKFEVMVEEARKSEVEAKSAEKIHQSFAYEVPPHSDAEKAQLADKIQEVFKLTPLPNATLNSHRAALSPEQQGRQAFHDHKKQRHCPYKFAVDQVKHNLWRFGYREAEQEASRDKAGD